MVINYLSPKCCNIYPLNKDGDDGPNLPEGGTRPWLRLHAVGKQEEEGDGALSFPLVTSLLPPLPVPMESSVDMDVHTEGCGWRGQNTGIPSS